jgi:2-dehydro-3-deoxyphosphogluconate aldolase/(4S)-4-hydroxy-2-oxoglutarate aldolase
VRREEVVSRIRETGLIAIMRHTEASRAIETAETLWKAGVRVVEVTMNTAGATGMLAAIAGQFGGRLVVGAGTVMLPSEVDQAIDAGAQLIVSPHLNESVVERAGGRGVVVIPGAFTPTEIVRAWTVGADFVKVFPAGPVGPRYIRDVLAPLNQIPLVPTGGVGLDNAAEFIRAGAVALGLGSALVDPKLVASGQLEQIGETARKFLDQIQGARSARR